MACVQSFRVLSCSSFFHAGHETAGIQCGSSHEGGTHRLRRKACLKRGGCAQWLPQSNKYQQTFRLHARSDATDESREDLGEIRDAEKEGNPSRQVGKRGSSAMDGSEAAGLGEGSDWEAAREGEQRAHRAGASRDVSESGSVGEARNAEAQEDIESTLESSSEDVSDRVRGPERADDDTAQTKHVLDILHGRTQAEDSPHSPARSLLERFGGFRVSGPQVPLTLQPVKAREPEKAGARSEEQSGSAGSDEIFESTESSESQQAESVTSEPEAVVSAGETPELPVSEGETQQASAGIESSQPHVSSGAQSAEGKSDEGESQQDEALEEKKPIIITPGPSAAEIPIPPRTEEDERIIAAFEKKLNADWKVQSLESELGLYLAKVKALEKFKEELARPDDDIDLVRASALIAQHA
jgi:hypothetical protein